ncbi:host cell division inhibitor Icd-like protein [Salmonella enterica]|nr:host cell division inhibitor Icd-like protein [Salmonella enterica]
MNAVQSKGFPLAGLLHICAVSQIPGKKGLQPDPHPVYGYRAPAKSGAGCRNPENTKATTDANSVFFIVAMSVPTYSSVQIRSESMVMLIGQPFGWPVSFVSGIPTPVSVTTNPECRNSGGDSLNTKENATWLRSQSHYTLQKLFCLTSAANQRKNYPTLTRFCSPCTANAGKCSSASNRHWTPLALSTWRQIMTKYLFLAVVRANKQDKPHREEVIATSEREARKYLAGRYVLSFAGRLPVQEVAV